VWGSNSALTGLASIGAGATFTLENKAAVSTTRALVNDGNLTLDPLGSAGSTLSIGGALTNTGTLDIGSGGVSAVTVKSFVNRGSSQNLPERAR
jgi:hypothetical protein